MDVTVMRIRAMAYVYDSLAFLIGVTVAEHFGS